jgi:hypothetical protein
MMYDDYEYIRVDSLITERMTSNPQIVNMYGFCGFTMLTECFTNGDIEEDVVGFEERERDFQPEEDPVLTPYNNFTGSQKLQLALSMVEPVSALHNFRDGVIVHDDIQLSQFLWTDDTKTAVKLNDFNRAEVMFWDENHQEYCRYRNGRGPGDVCNMPTFAFNCFLMFALAHSFPLFWQWRSPEEYRNDPLNEKIDIYSLCKHIQLSLYRHVSDSDSSSTFSSLYLSNPGNNFYSLLTGYYHFYDEEDSYYLKVGCINYINYLDSASTWSCVQSNLKMFSTAHSFLRSGLPEVTSPTLTPAFDSDPLRKVSW